MNQIPVAQELETIHPVHPQIKYFWNISLRNKVAELLILQIRQVYGLIKLICAKYNINLTLKNTY